MREVVFVNGGQVYRDSSALDLSKTYLERDDFGVPLRKSSGKLYQITTACAEALGHSGGIEVTWGFPGTLMGIGELHDLTEYYINIKSSTELQELANALNLPMPCSQEQCDIIDTNPESIAYRITAKGPIVLASVKFVGGNPILLKLYTIVREIGLWFGYMYGCLWEKTSLAEVGAILFRHSQEGVTRDSGSKKKNEYIVSSKFEYSVGGNQDPIFDYKGTDASGNIKTYETSKAFRKIYCSYNKGFEHEAIGVFWVARSTYLDETEYYFAALNGTADFELVAKHYELTLPYTAEQAETLDTNPAQYRIRHYKAFTGEYKPIVIGSVLYQAEQPIELRLYTFHRPWEEPCDHLLDEIINRM